jgi:hypothetical protein
MERRAARARAATGASRRSAAYHYAVRGAPRLAALAAALAAGCGGSGGDALAPKELAADLTVVVRAGGPGTAARVHRVQCGALGRDARGPLCRRLGDLGPADLAPVPADRACTQVFGGPATARVEGTLRGKRVSARFDLNDGCEIARWRRNADLLGPPPLPGPGPA